MELEEPVPTIKDSLKKIAFKVIGFAPQARRGRKKTENIRKNTGNRLGATNK